MALSSTPPAAQQAASNSPYTAIQTACQAYSRNSLYNQYSNTTQGPYSSHDCEVLLSYRESQRGTSFYEERFQVPDHAWDETNGTIFGGTVDQYFVPPNICEWTGVECLPLTVDDSLFAYSLTLLDHQGPLPENFAQLQIYHLHMEGPETLTGRGPSPAPAPAPGLSADGIAPGPQDTAIGSETLPALLPVGWANITTLRSLVIAHMGWISGLLPGGWSALSNLTLLALEDMRGLTGNLPPGMVGPAFLVRAAPERIAKHKRPAPDGMECHRVQQDMPRGGQREQFLPS